MSMLDADAVRKVANLASLSLSDDEVTYYKDKLQTIIQYVNQLSEFDAVAVEARPEPELTPERADEVMASLPADLVFANASKSSGTAFQVPRIME